MHVLFAFPTRDHDLAEEVNDLIRSHASQRQLHVKASQFTSHLETSTAAFADGDFSHCVIHDDLPANWRAAPVSGGGFELAKHIRMLNTTVKTCLLHSRKSWSDADATLATRLNLQLLGDNEAGLAELLTWLMVGGAPTSTIDIVIELSKDLRNSHYMIVSSDGRVAPREGPLNLREGMLAPLEYLSKDLDDEEKWERALQALRTTLRYSLIDNQLEFKSDLHFALQPGATHDNTRLLFRVQPEQYEVAFEAIQYPIDDSFWMLRAPVFRSLHVGGSTIGASIFEGPERRPLKSLIIVSGASGPCVYEDKFGNVLDTVEYADLPNAALEAQTLQTALGAAGGGQSPVAVPLSHQSSSIQLKEALSREMWDIVHFIGHTDYRGDRGFLILPGSRPSEPQAVGLEEFAPHLTRTRLVYLSSCHGTKLAFVRRLAEHGVSSVLGYRTKVRDTLALEHTKYFYEKLFELKSIERAFFCARQHFHMHHPKDRLWACSSLIMQSRSRAA